MPSLKDMMSKQKSAIPGQKDPVKWATMKNEAAAGRRKFERDWWFNLAFLNGDHYVNYEDQSATLVEQQKEDEDEIRPVRNVTLKVKRVEKAKLLRAHPEPAVTPATTEITDYAAAQLLEAYFKHLMHYWRFQRKLSLHTDWKVTTGTGVFKWTWSNNKDNPECTVISPFDFYPDPYAKTPDTMRWAIDSRFMSVEEAIERYRHLGVDPALIQANKGTRYNDLQLRLLTNFDGTSDENLPGVTVNELFIKPGVDSKYPKGKWVVFTHSHVLYEGDFPYDHGMLPYTISYHIERANSLWGDCILNHVREINREINYTEAQIIYNRNLSNGKYLLGPGVELEEPPTAEPGQILRISQNSPGNGQFDYIQIPALDGAVLNEPARMGADMHDLAMLHEVSMGGVPGRVESGQAIQLLQEADDSVLAESEYSTNFAIADGFWQVANLFKQRASKEVSLVVFDNLGTVEHHVLKKTDLGDIPEVRFHTDSSLPRSVAGRRDTVLQLWQYGIIQDPEEGRELLGLTPDTQSIQLRAEEKRVADNENLLMLETDDKKFWPVRPSPYDDHRVHIERHKRAVRSKKYRADVTDRERASLDRHIMEHEQLWEDQLKKETRRQMIMQGIDPDQPAPDAGAAGAGPAAPPGAGPPPEGASDVAEPGQAPPPPPAEGGIPDVTG